ncbi:uncharacterized protein A1O9_07256 [Exophiala aquamarina CBS 119918]|uniref:NAD-dependent epimerase/dehydratase domain-containing protein n=1 Tax=Exophiala aquamarina CBS 119918 TaxID=1182545 RepID=A0A072PB09_9EURO|nr:uncharacterized protein A1O9_07256 [Exophiala aquamarina CBS 119918]KEF57066.1 hypothetical protein A1O9_07256 [Exophiala aquamarina CBS 119918]
MAKNILITGAGGYIGGTLLTKVISQENGLIKAANITATVRSAEQAQRLSEFGFNAIELDLKNEEVVKQAVISNNIDVVVHIASAMETAIAANLIKALGERRKLGTGKAYFIHSSVTAVFSKENGWPFGEVKDTDPLYENEKQLAPGHPVRDTNVLVTDLAKAEGVTSLIVVVPVVYGTGSGEFRNISSAIPSFIRASIELQTVYKFDKDATPATTHVSDIVGLYMLLVEKILNNEPLPTGDKGYHFAMAHKTSWWKVMQRLAEELHALGLVNEPNVAIWPSDEMAAKSLGWPPSYVRAMGTSSGDIIPVNPFRLGWQPTWTEERFLGNMDEEIRATLEQGDKFKSTLYDSL